MKYARVYVGQRFRNAIKFTWRAGRAAIFSRECRKAKPARTQQQGNIYEHRKILPALTALSGLRTVKMKMEELIRSRAQQAGLAGWRGELAASGFFCSWLLGRPWCWRAFSAAFCKNKERKRRKKRAEVQQGPGNATNPVQIKACTVSRRSQGAVTWRDPESQEGSWVRLGCTEVSYPHLSFTQSLQVDFAARRPTCHLCSW